MIRVNRLISRRGPVPQIPEVLAGTWNTVDFPI